MILGSAQYVARKRRQRGNSSACCFTLHCALLLVVSLIAGVAALRYGRVRSFLWCVLVNRSAVVVAGRAAARCFLVAGCGSYAPLSLRVQIAIYQIHWLGYNSLVVQMVLKFFSSPKITNKWKFRSYRSSSYSTVPCTPVAPYVHHTVHDPYPDAAP